MDEPIETRSGSIEQESVSTYSCGGYCGDYYCDTFESYTSCPTDCAPATNFCGDGYCDFREDAYCCSTDCPLCGDGLCEGDELYTCSADCDPWGTISASPKNVYIPSGQTGSTTIEWTAYLVSTAQVYVKQGTNPEKLFAQSRTGSQTATWIKPGKTYKFKLYEGTSHSNWLKTVEVKGIETVCGNGICEPNESCLLDCDPCGGQEICP